jgi:hypothetical protein
MDDGQARMTFREAAQELVSDHEWTLSDLIDTLGEIEEIEDEYDQLMVIVERGV